LMTFRVVRAGGSDGDDPPEINDSRVCPPVCP
jgi:hypothetical protein